MDKEKWQKEVYILENLGCAHCASLMEEKIRSLPDVAEAVIVFASKELRLLAKEPSAQIPAIRQICQGIEADVKVVPKDEAVQQEPDNSKKEWIELIFGAVMLALVSYMEKSVLQVGLCLVAYIILGRTVLVHAWQNIRHGRALDENFLMAVATLGAFFIGEQPEGVGVMLFYRIGEFFEERAVNKSRQAIMAAADLQPNIIHRIKGDQVEDVLAADAVEGDTLIIRPGERIPADGEVVKGESRIDTAALTGEPLPIRATPGLEVFSGYLNMSGVLEMRVLRPAASSMAARILAAVESAAASKPHIEKFISRFAKVYTPIVVGAAVVTAIVPPLFTGQWEYWIYAALTFLVISCPCALVLSVPLAFFAAIGVGSKRGILFKGGAALEALAKVKQIVFDKTGTLTKGDFSLRQVICFDSEKTNEQALLQLAATAEQNSSHPLAACVLAAAEAAGTVVKPVLAAEEIAGHGVRVSLAEGELLCGNEKLMESHGVEVSPISGVEYGSKIYIALNGKLEGLLIVADAVKEEAPAALRRLQASGKKLAMLTGDSEAGAAAAAAKLGISSVYAGLLPEDKLARLQALREEHGPALFVGDGINDAPVLAGADCSASMGSGSAMAVEAADIVFVTNQVSAVGQAIGIAKAATSIAWQNIVLAIGTKVAILILGLWGFASLWLAIFADTGIALICVLNSIRLLYRKRDFS